MFASNKKSLQILTKLILSGISHGRGGGFVIEYFVRYLRLLYHEELNLSTVFYGPVVARGWLIPVVK